MVIDQRQSAHYISGNQRLRRSNEVKYIFGPVPSRRLGISLGVDLVPFKTCTFNCIYCQLERTTNQTLKRKEYIKAKNILSELQAWFIRENSRKKNSRKFALPNYITLSGSGEPTLNSKIGEIISGIKKMTSIPVAVLTNGSLLYRKEVRDSLKEADLVVPSLDAASAKTFKKINRPVKSLGMEKIIKGLMDFRKEYRKKIWLEIMLVKGINDKKEEIKELKKIIAKIKPDKVQLNTIARPPCEKFAKALSNKELERIKNLLGPPTEVIVDFERRALPSKMKDVKKGIMTMLKRRPATVKDLADGLGVHRNEVLKYLALLEKEKKTKSLRFRDKRYYQIR
jgi:wyosine [tRNA(Phe)-imidazoG37] synthetase (radical SAM superfamily)